jgi:hypothetical protein
VASPHDARSGLLIIRVRLLDDSAPDGSPLLIATITTTLDLATREETRTTARSVDEIVAVVRRWIDSFVTGSANDESLTNR